MQILQKNLFPLILVAGTVAVILIVINHQEEPSAALIPTASQSLPNTEQVNKQVPSEILVDIKGEVNDPGVYEMEPNSRVKDVVTAAGGFTQDANQEMINLAQKVFDEMIIIVPMLGGEGNGTTSFTQSNKIRINYATVEEIEQLSGIGPSKAKAIVEYREEHGYFHKVEDLLKVSGIGEKTLAGFREEIQIP